VWIIQAEQSAAMTTETALPLPAHPLPQKLPKKLHFPYAGPLNGLEQPGLPLFGYAPALSEGAPVTPIAQMSRAPSKLYLVPTPVRFDGEDLDPDVQPKPSASKDLPEIEQWVSRYVTTLLEIWSGKRGAMQLARWTHRKSFEAVANPVGRSALPKIRNIYISQPIDGVAEVTVTLRYDERVRSLVLRFEGVDDRWLCTELMHV